MNIIEFKRRRRGSPSSPYNGTIRSGVALRFSKGVIPFAFLGLVLIIAPWQRLVGAIPSASFVNAPISVIDGDTVRYERKVYRLVGFDTPEAGRLAGCERERSNAAAATNRLRQLLVSDESTLQPVPCACRPGTEGTRACNFGRLCGVLEVNGRDVASTMIGEGLARTYVCNQTGCPRRGSWCG